MTTVREIERLSAELGFSATKLDLSLRSLRDDGRLPVKGRGVNAPDIGPAELAAILIGYVGSYKAINASKRLKKLENITNPDGQTLLAFLIAWIEGKHDGARQLHISRSHSRAYLYKDAAEPIEFLPKKPKTIEGRLQVVGIIDQTLIDLLAGVLNGSTTSTSISEVPDDEET